MALLAFDDTSKSPIGYLLDHVQRQKTASELNAAILTAQCQEKGRAQVEGGVLVLISSCPRC